MEDDYFSILNAKNLILSNSSFSVFPSYLNKNANRIIAPKYCDPILLNNNNFLWGSPTNIYPFMEYFDWKNNTFENYDKNYIKNISKDTIDKLSPFIKVDYLVNKKNFIENLKPINKMDFKSKHPGLKYVDSYKVKWRDLILLIWKIKRWTFLVFNYLSEILMNEL